MSVKTQQIAERQRQYKFASYRKASKRAPSYRRRLEQRRAERLARVRSEA